MYLVVSVTMTAAIPVFYDYYREVNCFTTNMWNLGQCCFCCIMC